MIALLALAFLTATPETAPAQLAAAVGGDTLTLSCQFPRIVIPAKVYEPPLIIEAGTAKIAGVTMAKVSNVVWRGGNIAVRSGADAVATAGYGIAVNAARNITIEGPRIGNANKGIAIFGGSDNITVTRAVIRDLPGDGIVIAASSNIRLTDNIVGPFTPPNITPTGAYHQDGFQFWANVRNIFIARNSFEGTFQAITDLGPSADVGKVFNTGVEIEDNDIRTTSPHGITTINSPGAKVRRNRLLRVTPRGRFDPMIRIAKDSATIACGNTNEWRPTSIGTAACR